MNAASIRIRILGMGIIASLLYLVGCSGSPNNVPVPPVIVHTYLGSQTNADDLANLIVGWYAPNANSNTSIAYRIRSEHDGPLKAIRTFFIWSSARAGYQSGTGGQIQVQVQTDDGTSNHYPSGTALASLVYHPPVTSSASSDHFPLLTFASPPTLSAGQLYHIVFTNIDPNPKANWVSLDGLWMWRSFTPEQPTKPNTDLAVLERGADFNQGAWGLYTRGAGNSITPCLELDFEGAAQGQGYIQGFGAPDAGFVNPKPITGAQQVREVFTLTGTAKVVSSISVRVNRTSGSSPLSLRVEKTDGTVLGQGSALVPMGGAATSSSNGESWVKALFPGPITLLPNVTYRLVLTSPTDTVHATHVLQKGSDYGFQAGTYFPGGHAEFNDGSGWRGWDLWGIPNVMTTDLQFFFEVDP
jgi:hypothetical protein